MRRRLSGTCRWAIISKAVAKQAKNPKAVANWVINNLRAKLTEAANALWRNVKIQTRSDHSRTRRAGRQRQDQQQNRPGGLRRNVRHRRIPGAIVQKKGLAQVSDTGAIEKFCDEAIAANPGPAADFRAGKVAALNFLKGQVMKLSKGKANPALVGEILERKLKP